jgi:hypothetical protein
VRWTGCRGRQGRLGVLVVLAAASTGACAFEPTAYVIEGTTYGTSESFMIEAGTHAITWAAWDAASPADGCLFGLLLDPLEVAPQDPAQSSGFDIPKLAYQVLDGGDTFNGTVAMELPGGTYQFVIEGSCAWSIRVDRH